MHLLARLLEYLFAFLRPLWLRPGWRPQPCMMIGEDMSDDQATWPNKTSSEVLVFHGTTLSMANLESMLPIRLTRLELKTVKIVHPHQPIQYPSQLQHLTIDNCPDLINFDLLNGLGHLKTFTIGVHEISEDDANALNVHSAEKNLILYGRRNTNDVEFLDRVRKLRAVKFVDFGKSTYPIWVMRCPHIIELRFENGHLVDSEADPFDWDEPLVPPSLRCLELNCTIGKNISSYLFTHSSHIQELKIARGSIWPPFSQLQNLTSLELFVDELDEDVLNGITVYLNQVVVLKIGGFVDWTAERLDTLHRLPNLRELQISNGIIKSGGLEVLCTLPNIARLALYCRLG